MENKTRHDEITIAVTAFHKAHPKVWKLFDKFTRNRIALGFRHYSSQAIFERIRWETDQAKTGDNEFKLNNTYMPFYSRRWMKMNPEYDGFFRTRKQKSKDAPAINRPELTPADFPGEFNDE